MDALKGWKIYVNHVSTEKRYMSVEDRKKSARNEYHERIGLCKNNYEVHCLIEEISNKYNICKDVFVSKYW